MEVSVVLPVYNEERWIGSCLDSLLSQTKKPFNIYVLDDGSTDSTMEIVRSYREVILIENKHLHRPAQVKKALDLPLKEITHLAEADALYDENFLKTTCLPIEKGEADLCHGRIFTRNPEKLLPRIVENYRRRRWGSGSTETQTGWVFRTTALRDIEIPTDIYIAEDQVIGAQIREKGYRTQYVPEATFKHYEKESLRELFQQQLRWGVGTVPLLTKYGHMSHQKNIRDRWFHLGILYFILLYFIVTLIVWPLLFLASSGLLILLILFRGLLLALKGEDRLAGFLFIFYRIFCLGVGFIGFNRGLILKAMGRDLLRYT